MSNGAHMIVNFMYIAVIVETKKKPQIVLEMPKK